MARMDMQKIGCSPSDWEAPRGAGRLVDVYGVNMSKNNITAQRNDIHRASQRELSNLEHKVLSLFNQLSEADQQHVIRLLQALRDTSS